MPRAGTVDPSRVAWDPWSPHEVAARLAVADRRWCIAGGWALDLWLGRQTRPHGDIEVSIARADFAAFAAALSGFRLFIAAAGRVTPLEPGTGLPAHANQVWVQDEAAGVWRLDLMLDPGDGDTWVFRRDPRLRRPRAEAIGESADGIPYLMPELVLLYKAKAPRTKDEVDFATCAPGLSLSGRRWLMAALESVHPGHPWQGALAAQEPSAR